MSILTSIIPGLRDSRAPLVAGLIWLAAAWLTLPLLPTKVLDAEAFEATRKMLEHLPTAGSLTILTLVAYLLGIIMDALAQALFKLTVPVANKIPILLAAALVVIVLFFVWRLVLILLTISAVAYTLHKRHTHPERIWTESLYRFVYLAGEFLRELSMTGIDAFRTAFVPSYSGFLDLRNQELLRWLDTYPDFLPNMIRALDIAGLHRTVEAVYGNHEEDAFRFTRSVEKASGNDLLSDSCVAPLLEVVNLAEREQSINQIVRLTLLEAVKSSDEKKIELADKMLDFRRLESSLINQLERINLTLHAKHENIYAEYDRIRSEGEFRKSVSLPIATLVGLVAYRLWSDLGGNEQVLALGSVGVFGIAALLIAAGEIHERKAQDMLYACIRSDFMQEARTELSRDWVSIKNINTFWLRLQSRYRRIDRENTLVRVSRAASD